MKKNGVKDRKKETIKEVFYPKIKIYDLQGRVIGILGLGESINYQELLLKKAKGIHKIKRG